MEEKKVSTVFEEMRDDVSKFIINTLELGKLDAYEKISLGTSAILYGLILAGSALFALLFIFITAGLYLGELFQSVWVGFGIVAAFTVLMLLIILIMKKPVKKKITNRVVRILMESDEKDKNSKQ
jgi:hypothetical protein